MLMHLLAPPILLERFEGLFVTFSTMHYFHKLEQLEEVSQRAEKPLKCNCSLATSHCLRRFIGSEALALYHQPTTLSTLLCTLQGGV
jgi:hypothetical protein